MRTHGGCRGWLKFGTALVVLVGTLFAADAWAGARGKAAPSPGGGSRTGSDDPFPFPWASTENPWVTRPGKGRTPPPRVEIGPGVPGGGIVTVLVAPSADGRRLLVIALDESGAEVVASTPAPSRSLTF